MARLQLFLAALWWGSMVAVGFMVVPLLFVNLDTPAIAGQMAAKLFSAQTWLTLACGLLLLMAAKRQRGDGAFSPSIWVISGLFCALVLELAIKPHIMARDNLAVWHNLGSLAYLLQTLCAAKTLWDLWPAAPATQAAADLPD